MQDVSQPSAGQPSPNTLLPANIASFDRSVPRSTTQHQTIPSHLGKPCDNRAETTYRGGEETRSCSQVAFGSDRSTSGRAVCRGTPDAILGSDGLMFCLLAYVHFSVLEQDGS